MIVHQVQQRLEVAGLSSGSLGDTELLLAPRSNRQQRLFTGLLLWEAKVEATHKAVALQAWKWRCRRRIATRGFLGSVSGSSLISRFGTCKEVANGEVVGVERDKDDLDADDIGFFILGSHQC
jgi:hypothetical protein